MVLTEDAWKEAYILKVPCITLRDETEWVETVEDGWNVLVGADKDEIIKAANGFIPKKKQGYAFGIMASERICRILRSDLV